MTVKFVPPRVALVDPRTGLITREWYIFLQGLFTSSDGGDVVAGDDFLEPPSMADIAGADMVALSTELGLLPPAAPAPPIPDDVLPSIGALRDQIAMLERRIDDLSKGTIVL